MKTINKTYEIDQINGLLSDFPVVAIVGPRQSGKTTLAKQLGSSHYFDLENPRDLTQFDNPQLTLENLKGLIVIDEIQRRPELFSVLRYLVDTHPDQSYLILGSASPKLLKQSSESLAGRIAFLNLYGLNIFELGQESLDALWIRGQLPKSILARSDHTSRIWRENYIATFLERDIPTLGIQIPAETVRRFWTMLAHYHGQLMNYSEMGKNFGISDMTVRKYLDILQATFMIRLYQPWYQNIGKRLVKRPKIYFRNSGLLHSLLSIHTKSDLQSHPKLGASWEGFALEIVTQSINISESAMYFWRTQHGAELDLFWQYKGQNWGVEIKYSDSPKLTPSMKNAMKDLDLKHIWVIYPGSTSYRLQEKISVKPLKYVSRIWDYKSGIKAKH